MRIQHFLALFSFNHCFVLFSGTVDLLFIFNGRIFVLFTFSTSVPFAFSFSGSSLDTHLMLSQQKISRKSKTQEL
jgi:hypothetical protein